MGNMTMNMILRSYVLGFNGSLITLLSQAYGSKHFVRMGEILSKAFVLHTLWMIPLLMVLFFTKDILMVLGQSEMLSENVQLYVRIAMFGFIFQLYFDIYRKFLNAMRLFHVHSPVTYVALILHFGWWYLLICYFELGVIGAGIVSIIQSFTNFFVILWIVHYFGYGKESAHKITFEVFKDWQEMFRHGIPTFCIQLFDFLSVEFAILLSGYLDPETLVANASFTNLLYISFLYIYAVTQSAAPMIGNKIGEGCKISVRKLVNSCIFFWIIFTSVVTIILLLFGDIIYSLYTTNESIIDKMNKISIAFYITLIAFWFKHIFCCILIGIGLQNKTILFNILSYIVIGVPIWIFWTFYMGWIYEGPWLGIFSTILLNAGYYYYLYLSHDIQYFIDEHRKNIANIPK